MEFVSGTVFLLLAFTFLMWNLAKKGADKEVPRTYFDEDIL